MERIVLGHGGGGRLSRDLVAAEIVSRFGNSALNSLGDAALISVVSELAFSTDGFVVKPLEFPGGNIGDLAVFGTVNDLAAAGSVPKFLSLGLILEEGLAFDVLRRVLDSIRDAAARCNVQIVTGDTKVVGRGEAEGMFVHTSGIGERTLGYRLGADRIKIGDSVIVTGTLGDHGMAVMAAREGLSNAPIVSDTGPVHGIVGALSARAESIHFFRDPTRGGLAAVCNEIVEKQAFGIELEEDQIPFSPAARSLAEMLGIELLHVASEGRLVVICDHESESWVLDRLRVLPESAGARTIGQVGTRKGLVTLTTSIGGHRLVDLPQGEILPRIC
jgi:hydrogenase expression/formation protein HypE